MANRRAKSLGRPSRRTLPLAFGSCTPRELSYLDVLPWQERVYDYRQPRSRKEQQNSSLADYLREIRASSPSKRVDSSALAQQQMYAFGSRTPRDLSYLAHLGKDHRVYDSKWGTALDDNKRSKTTSFNISTGEGIEQDGELRRTSSMSSVHQKQNNAGRVSADSEVGGGRTASAAPVPVRNGPGRWSGRSVERRSRTATRERGRTGAAEKATAAPAAREPSASRTANKPARRAPSASKPVNKEVKTDYSKPTPIKRPKTSKVATSTSKTIDHAPTSIDNTELNLAPEVVGTPHTNGYDHAAYSDMNAQEPTDLPVDSKQYGFDHEETVQDGDPAATELVVEEHRHEHTIQTDYEPRADSVSHAADTHRQDPTLIDQPALFDDKLSDGTEETKEQSPGIQTPDVPMAAYGQREADEDVEINIPGQVHADKFQDIAAHETEPVAQSPVADHEPLEHTTRSPVGEYEPVEHMARSPVAEYEPVEHMTRSLVAEYEPVEHTVAEHEPTQHTPRSPVAEHEPLEHTTRSPVAEYEPVEHMAASPVTEYEPVEHITRSPVAEYEPVEHTVAEHEPMQHTPRSPVAEYEPVEHNVAEHEPMQHMTRSPVAEYEPVEHTVAEHEPMEHMTRSPGAEYEPVEHTVAEHEPMEHMTRSPVAEYEPVEHSVAEHEPMEHVTRSAVTEYEPVEHTVAEDEPMEHMTRSPVAECEPLEHTVAEHERMEHTTRSTVAEYEPVEHMARSPVAEYEPVEQMARSPTADHESVENMTRSSVADHEPVERAVGSPVAEHEHVEHLARSPVAEYEPVEHVVRSPVAEYEPVDHMARPPLTEYEPVEHKVRSPVAEHEPIEHMGWPPVAENEPVEHMARSPIADREPGEHIAQQSPIAEQNDFDPASPFQSDEPVAYEHEKTPSPLPIERVASPIGNEQSTLSVELEVEQRSVDYHIRQSPETVDAPEVELQHEISHSSAEHEMPIDTQTEVQYDVIPSPMGHHDIPERIESQDHSPVEDHDQPGENEINGAFPETNKIDEAVIDVESEVVDDELNRLVTESPVAEDLRQYSSEISTTDLPDGHHTEGTHHDFDHVASPVEYGKPDSEPHKEVGEMMVDNEDTQLHEDKNKHQSEFESRDGDQNEQREPLQFHEQQASYQENEWVGQAEENVVPESVERNENASVVEIVDRDLQKLHKVDFDAEFLAKTHEEAAEMQINASESMETDAHFNTTLGGDEASEKPADVVIEEDNGNVAFDAFDKVASDLAHEAIIGTIEDADDVIAASKQAESNSDLFEGADVEFARDAPNFDAIVTGSAVSPSHDDLEEHQDEVVQHTMPSYEPLEQPEIMETYSHGAEGLRHYSPEVPVTESPKDHQIEEPHYDHDFAASPIDAVSVDHEHAIPDEDDDVLISHEQYEAGEVQGTPENLRGPVEEEIIELREEMTEREPLLFNEEQASYQENEWAESHSHDTPTEIQQINDQFDMIHQLGSQQADDHHGTVPHDQLEAHEKSLLLGDTSYEVEMEVPAGNQVEEHELIERTREIPNRQVEIGEHPVDEFNDENSNEFLAASHEQPDQLHLDNLDVTAEQMGIDGATDENYEQKEANRGVSPTIKIDSPVIDELQHVNEDVADEDQHTNTYGDEALGASYDSSNAASPHHQSEHAGSHGSQIELNDFERDSQEEVRDSHCMQQLDDDKEEIPHEADVLISDQNETPGTTAIAMDASMHESVHHIEHSYRSQDSDQDVQPEMESTEPEAGYDTDFEDNHRPPIHILSDIEAAERRSHTSVEEHQSNFIEEQQSTYQSQANSHSPRQEDVGMDFGRNIPDDNASHVQSLEVNNLDHESDSDFASQPDRTDAADDAGDVSGMNVDDVMYPDHDDPQTPKLDHYTRFEGSVSPKAEYQGDGEGQGGYDSDVKLDSGRETEDDSNANPIYANIVGAASSMFNQVKTGAEGLLNDYVLNPDGNANELGFDEHLTNKNGTAESNSNANDDDFSKTGFKVDSANHEMMEPPKSLNLQKTEFDSD